MKNSARGELVELCGLCVSVMKMTSENRFFFSFLLRLRRLEKCKLVKLTSVS